MLRSSIAEQGEHSEDHDDASGTGGDTDSYDEDDAYRGPEVISDEMPFSAHGGWFSPQEIRNLLRRGTVSGGYPGAR